MVLASLLKTPVLSSNNGPQFHPANPPRGGIRSPTSHRILTPAVGNRLNAIQLGAGESSMATCQTSTWSHITEKDHVYWKSYQLTSDRADLRQAAGTKSFSWEYYQRLISSSSSAKAENRPEN